MIAQNQPIMKKYLAFIVFLISLLTVLSGLLQLVQPNIVLSLVGADVSPISMHFFAIIGMFMLLFGMLMLHVLYSPQANRPAIIWSAMQKLGASAAVGLGVLKGIFGVLALGVAGFDLVSGIFLFMYLQSIRKERK